MIKVNLYTSNEQYVASVQIPAMNAKPDIIVVGNRYFVLRDDKYIEGLAWLITNDDHVTEEDV